MHALLAATAFAAGSAAPGRVGASTPPAGLGHQLAWPAAAAEPGDAVELLAVRLNGIEQPDLVMALRLAPDRIALPADALRGWHLRLPASPVRVVEQREFHVLDAMAGLRWRIDPATQTLELQAPPSAFAHHAFEVAGAPVPVQVSSPLGGHLNYDLRWQQEQPRGGPAQHLYNGLLEAGVFHRTGHGRSSGYWRAGGGRPAQFVRLDSTWNIDRPDTMQSLRIGDTIGAPGAWGRAVRLGGLQWATNFSTRPDLVRFALPAVRGEAAVPSVVDLYVNNALQLRGDVPPGPFDLPQVPVTTGQGQIRMVVRDLLGREQVVVQPYYVSPSLLRPGLRDFSVDAGWVREDYGLRGAQYGRMALTATDRRGVSPTFTREWRAELLQDQQTAGASGSWLLQRMAIATASVAASRSPRGSGTLAAMAVERQAPAWSATLQGRWSSRHFTQLGQLPLELQAPKASLNAGASWALGQGGVSLNWLQQSDWQGTRSRAWSLSHGRSLGAVGYLSLYATRNTGAVQATSLGVQFVRVLDGITSASAGHNRNRQRAPLSGMDDMEQRQNFVQVQRSLPAGAGWGYQLLAEQGQADRTLGEVSWQNDTLTLQGGAARLGTLQAYHASASGGLALMPEGVYASRRIDGSFAVVKVGDYEGVRVQRDSQVVARTDARGHAFISGLRGHERNRISVEPADLPMDAQVDRLHLVVAPAAQSGVSVVFPVQRQRSASLRLVLPDGRDVPPGSRVHLNGAEREFPVGFDGRLFLTGLAPRSQLVAEWPQQRCIAEVELPPLQEADDDVPELGARICRPLAEGPP